MLSHDRPRLLLTSHISSGAGYAMKCALKRDLSLKKVLLMNLTHLNVCSLSLIIPSMSIHQPVNIYTDPTYPNPLSNIRHFTNPHSKSLNQRLPQDNKIQVFPHFRSRVHQMPIRKRPRLPLYHIVPSPLIIRNQFTPHIQRL